MNVPDSANTRNVRLPKYAIVPIGTIGEIGAIGSQRETEIRRSIVLNNEWRQGVGNSVDSNSDLA